MIPDERTLRVAEGFVEGTPIKLADGQMWFFPPPIVTLFPYRQPDGDVVTYSRHGFGPKYDAKLARLMNLSGDEWDDRVLLMIGLAGELLLRNYTLTNDQLEILLPFNLSDDSLNTMWGEIGPILRGVAPKPSADGSGAV